MNGERGGATKHHFKGKVSEREREREREKRENMSWSAIRSKRRDGREKIAIKERDRPGEEGITANSL